MKRVSVVQSNICCSLCLEKSKEIPTQYTQEYGDVPLPGEEINRTSMRTSFRFPHMYRFSYRMDDPLALENSMQKKKYIILVALYCLILLSSCAQKPHALSEKHRDRFAQQQNVTILAAENIDNRYSILLVDDASQKRCIRVRTVAGGTFYADELLSTQTPHHPESRVSYYPFEDMDREAVISTGVCFVVHDPLLQRDTTAIVVTTETKRERFILPRSDHIYVDVWPREAYGHSRFATITFLDTNGKALFRIEPFTGRTHNNFPGIPTP